MTVAEVRKRLIRIGNAAREDDFDAAASLERALFIDVLAAVAVGAAGANEATAALTSLSLNFRRVSA